MVGGKFMKCVFCQVDLPVDMICRSCGREWEECEVEGEKGLRSKRRRVILTKIPEAGDVYNDVVKPYFKKKDTE
jgi:hypothetical protein